MTYEANKILLKRGHKNKLNKLLTGDLKPLKGEPIYEVDTGNIKIGDGEHNYNQLPYISSTRIYADRFALPSVGRQDALYILKSGDTYIWQNGKYVVQFANINQFYAFETDNDDNIIGVERQINAGGANADYVVEDYVINK